MSIPTGLVSPAVRRRSLVLKKFGFDYENPKSLQSITAEGAARLVMGIAHYERMHADLPMLFHTRLHRRKYREKFDWLRAKYSRRIDALQMLLDSYNELIKK